MKTVFAEPSRTYSIILSKEDAIKLITGGVLFMPSHTSNTYIPRSNKAIDDDGHYLQYHGPKEGTIPIQFVSIKLERDFK